MGARGVPVVFAVSGASIDLVVEAGEDATAGDLVRALAGGEVAGGTSLTVDGRPVADATLVVDAGIRAGSVLALDGTHTSGDRQRGTAELQVVGGLAAGVALPLATGRQAVGRGRHADVQLDAATVSRLHLVIDVDASGAATVHDTGSTNGTRIGGAFVIAPTALGTGDQFDAGAVSLRVRPADERDRGGRRAPGPFNRPPRRDLAAPARPLVPPRPRPAVAARGRLSVTALVMPLVAGGAMAVLWDPRLAAFCLLSPVLVVGNWFEERRRARRDNRARERDTQADLDRFRQDLAGALSREVARREQSCPDPVEIVRRATTADTRLWQRRAADVGAFIVRIGVGDERWTPPVDGEPGDAEAVLREATLVRAPITVDLAPGSVVGIAGDRHAAVAVARWIVAQLAVHLGPSDLRIAVLTETERVPEWSFAKWLPHAAGLVAASDDGADAVVAALHATDVTRLVVADRAGLASGRAARLRPLLSGGDGPALAVVLAATEDELPSVCTHVIALDGADGDARLREPSTARRVDGLLATGLAVQAADEIARALAPVEDPDAAGDHGGLPLAAGLLPLLGMRYTELGSDALVERWRSNDSGELRAVLGVTAQGPLVVDLACDGPHGLVGGTTGAGKSELLRTLVASLAATTSPEQLNIVLVDYKGGSAFDACAHLPHTVGVVTDLDEHLGRRALQCLEAELRHREAVLRDAGAASIDAARARGVCLPRLLVVIDEFATLAAELPGFVDALVGVAQRGRSLGVHLVLATQRPAGAVKDNIRANTNLRIALRMQDASDSNDVIGAPDAARIARDQRGRGLARLGPSELVTFQAALVSGCSAGDEPRAVTVRPFPFAPNSFCHVEPGAERQVPRDRTSSDLERLVDAARTAASTLGVAAQRRPWPDPLPAAVGLAEVDVDVDLRGERGERGGRCGGAGSVVVGLADDPAHQRRLPYVWDRSRGNLAVYGVAGSGTTTALETIAVSLARRYPPSSLHLYAMDFGAGRLASLLALSHTGAVVGATEGERQRRLVRMLRAELDRRRSAVPAAAAAAVERPGIVLLLDGWSAFSAAYDDAHGIGVRDDVARLVADGPAVGLWTVVTAERANALPFTIAGAIAQRLVLRLADRADWSAFGTGRDDIPPELPGRGIDAVSGLEVQVAIASPSDVAGGGPRSAPGIETLPVDVRLGELADVRAGAGSADGDVWRLPFGVDDATLTTAVLALHPGDHALITGPPRSGRSTALATLIASARSLLHEVGGEVVVLAPRRSPLYDQAGTLDLHDDGRPLLVVVDDCDLLDETDAGVAALLQADHPDVHVIAAGRSDALRSAYGHWSRELRRSRLGLALQPQAEDGDLFGTVFSRWSLPAPLPGRGLLVAGGVASTVQVARP